MDAVATAGNLLCAQGDVVRKGQVLISAYTDCGTVIRATDAEGDVFAQTFYELQAYTSTECMFRSNLDKRNANISIIIGKKLINFKKDSGISPESCAKISTYHYLHLPGGYQLPVALLVESISAYETYSRNQLPADHMWLKDIVEEQLLASMVCGKIIHQSTSFENGEDVVCLKGVYTCSEMIGRKRVEERLQGDLS